MENFNIVPDRGTFGGSVEVINQNFLLAQQALEMLEQGGIDKPYDPSSHSGMGRKILSLKKGGSNVLVQNDFDKTNTTYVIRYDFSLGENITIPSNCELLFEGGSLSGNTLNLNGCKIVNNTQYPIFNNISLTQSQNLMSGYIVYTSWFDWSDASKNASIFEGIFNINRYRGTLFVDTPIINFSRTLSLGKLTGYVIKGNFNSDAYTSKASFNLLQTSDSHLDFITFYGESNEIYNIELNANADDYTADVTLLNVDTPSSTTSDLDLLCYNVSFKSSGVSPHIIAKGRGLMIDHCLFHHEKANTNGDSCIRVTGKFRGDDADEWFHNSYTSMRAIRIVNNRFHVCRGAYVLELVQDTQNANTTFLGVEVSNNYCDGGVYGIKSSSKVRGLLVNGNTFVVNRNYEAGRYFNLFTNDISEFIFTNNILLSLLYYGESLNSNCTTFINFNSPDKIAEDITISNNEFDTSGQAWILNAICPEQSSSVPRRAIVKNVVIANNNLGKRAFSKYSEFTSHPAIFGLTRCNCDGVQIKSNNVQIGNNYPSEISCLYVGGSSVGSREIKNVFVAFNFNTNNSVNYENDNTPRTNVIEQKDIINT